MSPAFISFGFLFFFRLLLIDSPDSCKVDWWPILVSLFDEAFRYGSKGLGVFMLNTKSQLPQVISYKFVQRDFDIVFHFYKFPYFLFTKIQVFSTFHTYLYKLNHK